MPARRLMRILAVAAALLVAACPPAFAYIDPGTQSQVIQVLAVVLGALGLWLGILLWPFRKVLGWARRRLGPRLGASLFFAVAAAAAALIVWAVSAWTARETPTEAPLMPAATWNGNDRVIVLGMDALDPGLMTGLMERGDLPNFRRLRDTGTFTRLRTTLPPETPVAWSGIATGVNPGRHGLFDFIHRDPDTYKPMLSVYRVNTANLADRRDKRYLPVRHAKGFWTWASEAGVPASVIRWPAAFPPEPVTGRFLSGLGIPDVCGRLGRYSLLTTDPAEPGPGFKGDCRCGTWTNDTFAAAIAGPIVVGLTGRKESKLPVSLTRVGTHITARFGDSPPVTLHAGQWSDWIPVAFKPAWGKSVPAMVHAYLAALDPHLRLYVSTPEIDPMAPWFPITAPDAYARELAAAIGRYPTLGMPEDVNAVKDGVLPPEAFEQDMLRLFEIRKKQFDYELRRFSRGLLAFVFDESDRLQHLFWSTRDPDHPGYDPAFAARFGHVIPDLYKRLDGVLGEALRATDSRTTVIVLSDHGFHTYRTAVGLNSWLVENGYMTLRTADGRDGRELFADVDWAATRAYAVGFAGVYVNLKGRERNGVVRPGEDYDRLCEELAAKLKRLQDPATGQEAVRQVYRGEAVYRGERAKEGPDLIVGFNPGFRAEDRNAIGGAPRQVFGANRSLWSGDHLMDPSVVPGIFFSNRKIRGNEVRDLDVAPTILQCLGLKTPPNMEGVPLLDSP